MVKDRQLNSIKTEQVHSDPSLGTLPSLCSLRPGVWKAQISVFILDQPLMDFCLINSCNHIFHPQHLGHRVPQFISVSCEGPPSSVWFELASWEISNLSLCSPWNFSSWFPASTRSALNQAQHSPGCLLGAAKVTRILSHGLQKIFLCIHSSTVFAFFFEHHSITYKLSPFHTFKLPPTPTHHPLFSAGLLPHLVPHPVNVRFYSSTRAELWSCSSESHPIFPPNHFLYCQNEFKI